MSQTPRVHLIDGSSYIYRAFYAIRELKTSQGVPTNAIYGFSTMLLKVLREMNPEFLAVVVDARGPTFRHLAFEHYKANRPEMPESLRPQIQWIHEIIRALGIRLLEKEGYEADDIMGSLVKILCAQGVEVVLISGDKDLLQLIEPGVIMVDTLHDRVFDREAVLARYGVEPKLLPDLFGLMGDSSDNIPGVPGIGEKRARELLQRFGSLEGVFSCLEEVSPPKIREALSRFRDQAFLSKRLATIDTSMELEVSLESLRHGPADVQKLRGIFKALEFHRLLQEWTTEGEDQRLECRDVASREDLEVLLESFSHTETVGLWVQEQAQEPGRLAAMALAGEEAVAWYVPWAEDLEGLRPLLEAQQPAKVGHNIKAAMVGLGAKGICLGGVAGDTMVASYVLNPTRRAHGLEELAAEFLDSKLGEVTPDSHEGACQRAAAILKLHRSLEQELSKAGLKGLYMELELPLIAVLASMEASGIRVNTGMLQELSMEMEESLSRLEVEIHDLAGVTFNINSPQQLSEVLFERLKLPVLKKTKKGFSTDIEVLEELSKGHPLPAKILEYRSLAKLKSTYVDALPALVDPRTGRIHTSFNQTVTATGRLSSSGPNLQNIPVRTELGQRIRSAFVPGEGCWFLSADYSQVELRILAHLSADPVLREAFQKGHDVHARTAAELLGIPLESVTAQMRREAKVVNFGIIYGMTAYGLAKELGVEQKVAQAYIDGYFQRYKGVRAYLDKVLEQAREKGYVETLLGRRRYLPEILSSNPTARKFAERTAINTPIQGTAADLIKKAMIRIHNRLRAEGCLSRMILQVHDELLLEVLEPEREKIEALVKKEMESVHSLDVPLKVDLGWGKNWAEAH
ncbi:MAG: DNA polymerase I [bacterium]